MVDDAPEQPPRAEDCVFDEPWEGRAFALATVLHARGAFAWPDFQRRLVREIDAWNASHRVDEPYSYYRLWLQALEALLEETGLCGLEGLDTRVDELGLANPGHDHVARREPLAVATAADAVGAPTRRATE